MPENELRKLLGAVHADSGDDAQRWYETDGCDSVARAVLDAIYSTGNQ